ncbi:STAS domain-containing protein [Streptomyces griseoviridis]
MSVTGGANSVALHGRLDVRSAADARTALHTAVDDVTGDLVLDLHGLDSWDATGLGVIMGVHRRAARCGHRLVLRGVPPQMERLLISTRLHRILTIENPVDENVVSPPEFDLLNDPASYHR